MKSGCTYTAKDARQILKLTQRKLDYWDELGIVSPKRAGTTLGSKRKGRGKQRLYSFDDLIRLRVVRDLRATGLSLQKIQKGLKTLRKRTPDTEPLDELLVTDGKRFQRIRNDCRIEDMLANGQLMFGIVSLASLEQDVRQKIIQLSDKLESNLAS